MLKLLKSLVRITVLAMELGRMGEEREKKPVIFVVELTTEKSYGQGRSAWLSWKWHYVYGKRSVQGMRPGDDTEPIKADNRKLPTERKMVPWVLEEVWAENCKQH